MKRIALLLLCLLLLFSAAALTEGASLNEQGLLDAGMESVLTEDDANGFWQYASDTLSVTIHRYEETKKVGKKDRKLVYCIAEIYASETSPLGTIMTDATKKRVAGYKLVSPEVLEPKYSPIFAMCDDLYGIRLQKYKFQGVVIRNGEVMATKTRNSSKSRAWPNLDTLAVYGDGSMKTYVCDAYKAEDYLNMGATQVFSFGPWLLSEGNINPDVLKENYYPYNEPRAAIGMVEPWHYIAIVVKGRPDSKYAGVHLDWLAQKMQDLGCTEALNLDGGLTATMMFNGKVILSGGDALRSTGSMIAFGIGLGSNAGQEE